MAFLRLNGVTVPVKEGQFGKAADVVGERGRAINGKMRATFVANKRKWTGAMIPLDVGEAEAWRQLFLGEADYLSWDTTLYSARGIAPSAGHTATIVGGGQFNNAVDTGANPLTYQFLLPGSVTTTVSVWRFDGVSVWDHYVVRTDGAKWFNGVRNDATATPWLSILGTSVTIAAGEQVDDLFFFPFFVPNTWPPEIYDFAFSFGQSLSFPELKASGDTIEGESHGIRIVSPVLNNTEAMRAKAGQSNFKEAVSFDLEES